MPEIVLEHGVPCLLLQPQATLRQFMTFRESAETGNSQPRREKWQYYSSSTGTKRATQSNSLLTERDRKINQKKGH